MPLLLALLGCPLDKADTADTDTLACGDSLTCAATDVCIREDLPPECENRTDTGAPCPEGTTATMCGGAGIPCCCGPTPDPTYRCQDAGACGEVPTCDCLVDACPSDLACTSVGSEASRLFSCDELPAP